MYEKFLKGRKTFLLELHRIVVLLEGQARTNAIRMGMFGLWGDEPAIIDATDISTLRRYEDVLDQDTGLCVFDCTTYPEILSGAGALHTLDTVHDENIDYDQGHYSGRQNPAAFMRLLF